MKNTADKRYTIDELREENRHHTVTHVILWGEIPPDIHNLFSHLTHLRLREMWSSADYAR